MKKFKLTLCLMAALFVMPVAAGAGSIGVFCWQVAPYNDVVCFDIVSLGWTNSMTGWDHAPNSYKYGASGAVVFDEYNGVYALDWTSFAIPTCAYIDPSTLSGIWWDEVLGDSGDLLFIGAGPQLEGVVEGTGPRFRGRR